MGNPSSPLVVYIVQLIMIYMINSSNKPIELIDHVFLYIGPLMIMCFVCDPFIRVQIIPNVQIPSVFARFYFLLIWVVVSFGVTINMELIHTNIILFAGLLGLQTNLTFVAYCLIVQHIN